MTAARIKGRREGIVYLSGKAFCLKGLPKFGNLILKTFRTILFSEKWNRCRSEAK